MFLKFLSSELGLQLSVKYSSQFSKEGFNFCFYKPTNPEIVEDRIKETVKYIKRTNRFLYKKLKNDCAYIFLLGKPEYGFQLNNNAFYVNRRLVLEEDSRVLALLLLQLLYQKRVYEKMDIGRKRDYCSKKKRFAINKRIMGKSWDKYDSILKDKGI